MICVPLKQNSVSKLILKIKTAQKIADIVEIWFDEIVDLNEQNLRKIFKIKQKPFLYKSCGNLTKIEKILQYKPNYIDLDLSTSSKVILKVKDLSPKTKIILSFHDFQQTPRPAELKKIIKRMESKKADIFKVATKAQSFTDSLNMLALLEESVSKGKKAIFISMGKDGQITRTAGHLFGNYIMYAPLDSKEATAPGQISAKKLRKIINQV